MKALILAVVLFSFQTASGAIDVENSICEQFRLQGYLDLRYTEFGNYNTVPSREFDLVRSGLEASAALSGTLDAELKVEFRPGEVFLKNALVEWNPLSFARGRAGQFRRETLLGGNLSTWDLPMFERPLVYELREELTYGGRDIGMDVEIELPVGSAVELQGAAGVFNGDERGVEKEDNELLYSFRGTAEILPADVVLGGSVVAHRQGRVDSESIEGYISGERLFAFSADVAYEHSFSNWYTVNLFGEYSAGDNWTWLDDPVSGEDPPQFQGVWGALTANYTPWNISSIHKISLSVAYDRLEENTEFDQLYHRKISFIAAVYPLENIRIRFGGVRNSVGTYASADAEEYTDIIAEAGFRF